MRKWIIITLLALCVAAGWIFASPWLAMQGLRNAALGRDADALEQRVDFPAVRESLKGQLQQQVAREARQRGDDPIAGVGALLAGSLVGTLVDRTVTPEGVANLLETGQLTGRTPGQSEPEAEWQVSRKGLTRFTATPVARNGDPAPVLHFERQGLSWKLVGVDVPALNHQVPQETGPGLGQ